MTQLQLSGPLVKSITDTLTAHDPAAQDSGVAAQYLSAIVGFLLGQEEMTKGQRRDILDELTSFAEHVADDVTNQKSQNAARASKEAFGIWKPGMS